MSQLHTFKEPDHYKPGDIIIPHANILKRVNELAEEIAVGARTHNMLMVGILTGAVWFTVDLTNALYARGIKDMQLSFINVSSYPAGTSANYEPKIEYESAINPSGRDILVVDDILDTGKSLLLVKSLFDGHGVCSFRSVVLLNKPERRIVQYEPDHIGFTIPNIWIQGYGTDTDGYGRADPNIIKGPFRY